ncbi:SAC3 domain-containing protein 1 [Pantherophis guttatus]|uniref:SAC3 domain-containing protein 1 n=1 Tax=Pantherophis guttatus TaxID=94885 RepID=A0A6P9AWL5_PANGU|nr:SAC3 domain-containing protein 1 [Pantherophis guttatus]
MNEDEAEGPPRPALCKDMCPAGEFYRRRRQKRLHRLELGLDRQPDPARAVKEFSRPAAGQAPPPPADLRPPPVLLATVHHLLSPSVAEASQVSPAERCAFVADRLRAVRLDLALQRPPAAPCAALLERALLYLLHAGARLCNQAPARFDPHLHDGQLRETFAALRRAYRRPGAHPAQPRFQALFLLYHLGSPDALWQILQLSDDIRASPELKTALAIHWAFLEHNFARFFRLARQLPYLPSCALHPHLAKTRRLALLTFSHGFNAKNCRYPLARLIHLLAIDSPEEAADLCRAHGLTVIEGSVVFQKGSFRDSAPLENRTSLLLVDGKWKGTLLDLSERVCS